MIPTKERTPMDPMIPYRSDRRRTRPVLVALAALTTGIFACGGDADTAGEAVDEAVAGARDAVSDFTAGTRDFLADSRSEMEDLASRMQDGADDLNEATRDHWTETRDEAARLEEEIAAEVDELQDASGDEAEEIREEIREKQHEMSRWVHEAHLAVIDDKDDFVEYVSDHAQQMEDDLERLEGEAEDAGSEGVDELRSAYRAAAEQLDELGDKTGEEFYEAKRSLSSHLANLRADLDRRLNSGD